MNYINIHPRVPLCDREQEAVLMAKLNVLMASDWRPKNPSSAADWRKRPLSKSDVVFANWRRDYGRPMMLTGIDPLPEIDVRGFLVPLKPAE